MYPNCFLSRTPILNVTQLAPPHCVLQLHQPFLHWFICHALHSPPVCCWKYQNTLTLVGHSANHHKECSQYVGLAGLLKEKKKKRKKTKLLRDLFVLYSCLIQWDTGFSLSHKDSNIYPLSEWFDHCIGCHKGRSFISTAAQVHKNIGTKSDFYSSQNELKS